MPWLFNEDAALKRKLSGLTVTDENAPPGGRDVLVRFRLPEVELGKMKFPMIVIEHGSVSKADEREHRGGWNQIPLRPGGIRPVGRPGRHPRLALLDQPVGGPLQHRLPGGHLTAAARCMTARSPWRWPTSPGCRPASAIWRYPRTAPSAGWTCSAARNRTTPSSPRNACSGKSYMMRVSSELFPAQIEAFMQLVSNVDVDLAYYSDTYDTPPSDLVHDTLG